MRNRYPVILTTVEEDFRRIGLLPQDQLSEVDDPQKPRDIPSPDPSTLAGLDDSEGEKSAHQAGAKQPKPKMGPPADDAEKAGLDPDEEGGSVGAHKGESSKYHKVAGGKEASLESKQYMLSKKQAGVKGSGKNKGQKPEIASGLKPAKKIGGMHEGRFNKAAALVEEVQGLLRGVQISEEMDDLMRGFRLVAEDAGLLSDRLTEIADKYEVEELVSKMESLSSDAVEALSVIESELENVGGEGDEDEAIKHSGDVADVESVDQSDRDADEPYDIPSPAFKEQAEMVLSAMVSQLMEALEAYDSVVEEMYPGMSEEDDGGDDGNEVHVHAHGAKRVHIHAHSDTGDDDSGDDDQDADDHGGEMDHDSDDDMGSDDDMDHDHEDDMGDEPDHESDHDRNSIMAKMKALKARRSAMGGGRPFHGGGSEEDESY